MKLIEKLKNLNHLEKNILDYSKTEFIENGFHKANLDKIAYKLKIGKATIYRHFGNKIKLFFSIIFYNLYTLTNYYEKLKEINNFEEFIDFLINKEIEIFEQNWSLFEIFFIEEKIILRNIKKIDKDIKEVINFIKKNFDILIDIISDKIKNEINNNRIRINGEPKIFAYFLLETINHLIISYQKQKINNKFNCFNNFNNIDYFKYLKEFVLNSINYKKENN